MEILKVSSKSVPSAVAGAIASFVKEDGMVEIQAIGAGAVNQAVKAAAVAKGFLQSSKIDMVCCPAFTNIVIDGIEKTAISIICEKR